MAWPPPSPPAPADNAKQALAVTYSDQRKKGHKKALLAMGKGKR